MVTLVCLLVLSQPVSPVEKEDKVLTAEEFVDLAWRKRESRIKAIEDQIEQLPKKYDWEKLTADAKSKIEKPFRDQIATAKRSVDLDLNFKYPEMAANNEVFKLPRSNPRLAISDQYQVGKVVDGSSVCAVAKIVQVKVAKTGSISSRSTQTDIKLAVFEDLKETEFVEKPGAQLRLGGMWRRIGDTTVDGTKYPRATRWPHEDEVKKLWSKRLKEAEKGERDATRDKAAKDKEAKEKAEPAK